MLDSRLVGSIMLDSIIVEHAVWTKNLGSYAKKSLQATRESLCFEWVKNILGWKMSDYWFSLDMIFDLIMIRKWLFWLTDTSYFRTHRRDLEYEDGRLISWSLFLFRPVDNKEVNAWNKLSSQEENHLIAAFHSIHKTRAVRGGANK